MNSDLDRSKLKQTAWGVVIDIELVMKLKDEGYTHESIADALGVNKCTLYKRVHAYRKEHNLKPKRTMKAKKPNLGKLKK